MVTTPSFPIARRQLMALAASCALCGQAAHAAERPAGFPSTGKVSLIVPFAPGGTTDIVARILAERLQRRWASPVIVENKAGAGGNIGAEYVSHAKGDGQTLLVAATSFTNAPALVKNLRYDILQDFSPISLVATTPLVLMVSKQSGIGSVPELIARLRSKKGGSTTARAEWERRSMSRRFCFSTRCKPRRNTSSTRAAVQPCWRSPPAKSTCFSTISEAPCLL